MRLHQLEITAFGPFADTTRVDFDALSEAGLFLLTGPTGAGKTSVLDAVCFALYGEVPGDRQAAKRLRADQAAPGVAPAVSLELSLGGRRFRIVRSPAWERPKKRGTGRTTQQASVRFSEHGRTGWHLLSSRLDETGHLVTSLVGMNLTQFCQVAMLPQGRFQAFLRARSDERHKLLQQLFRTSRFEDIERWLRDRRRTLRTESNRHHERVSDLVSRLSETAGISLPDEWDLHDLATPAATGELAAWSGRHRGRAGVLARESATRASQATYAEHRTRSALDQANRLADDQATHAAAVAARELIETESPDHDRRLARADAARRAARVLPLQRVAVEQADERVRLAEVRTARTSAVARLLGLDATDLDRPALEAAAAQARAEAEEARALAPREEALADVRAALAHTTATIGDVEARRHEIEERLTELPGQVDDARAAHEEALEAGRRLRPARDVVIRLRDQQHAAAQADDLAGQLEEARSLLGAAVDAVQQHKEVWLRLREERLSGMAAEIAGALAVGDDCPVCGSVDHPRLAVARPGAPDASAERAARRLVDDAEATRLAHEGRVRDLVTRIAVARERAGDTEGIDDALADAESQVRQLVSLDARRTDLAARLTGLETALRQSLAERESSLVELASARASGAAQQSLAQSIAQELAELLGEGATGTLADLVAAAEHRVDACRQALAAVEAHDAARTAELRAQRRATAAARTAGFDDTAGAVAAALDEVESARIEQQVRDHELARARTDTVLSDPALRAAAAVTPPDLDQLRADQDRAESELARARTEAALQQARSQRLAGLDAELRSALEDWDPVRADLELTTRVAALADGTSADNRLQMRLSGYVLARRLSQVVAAANQRLARMSDQRYSLEHTGRRGAGETRGGLSLLVRDDWSGETRDPATLSGGETFVVSLALALGLADVIAHEVGGADLDTLFVDEGFGSLDADTLDDVMDTLDSLRDGGRVVGVVSHVAEMRDRIPVQLRVAKSRQGSSLSLSRCSS